MGFRVLGCPTKSRSLCGRRAKRVTNNIKSYPEGNATSRTISRRNKLVMENFVSSPLDTVLSSCSFLTNFHKCIVTTNKSSQNSEKAWSPPETEFVKTNFDATISLETGFAGIRPIVRDHEGRYHTG
ncbi:hypothetical protein Salat_1150100 [Sesamum alatum]|uniref:Uncharacterized protein n=1 Tax=Sesamum alatum TaxID=300844 RepID=A0AAE1YEC1_9LAMI|nr:hypothetical protein Salat_1150100 [Sesamum alatum]